MNTNNKYILKFSDDEGSDRIATEFAPVYDGTYLCVRRFTLKFEGKEFVPGSKVDVAQMERVSDKVLIYIIENGMTFRIPIYETHEFKFKPMELEVVNANVLDGHYDYAVCEIEKTI